MIKRTTGEEMKEKKLKVLMTINKDRKDLKLN